MGKEKDLDNNNDNIIKITSDFEDSFIYAINLYFADIRKIGC